MTEILTNYYGMIIGRIEHSGGVATLRDYNGMNIAFYDGTWTYEWRTRRKIGKGNLLAAFLADKLDI